MSSIYVIAKRDFKALICSSQFWLIGALCTVIWSFIYLRMLFGFASRLSMATMRGAAQGLNINYELFIQHISYVHIILLFAIPAITMRLIAEEKKQRTFDLLLTAPVTATDIALGKFFGAFASVLVLILISFLYPLGTAFFTSFSWTALFSAYLGLILASALYVAIGLYASSMTSSPILAMFHGFFLNFALWFVGASHETVHSVTVSNILEQASIAVQFTNFLKGTINLSSATFFVSAIGFFVFISQRVIESARWR